MSILGIFDIGKTAMFASQTALSVTSHNIANANTPGFSRQEVVLSLASPAQVGGHYMGRGVTVSAIRRQYDRFIESQLLGQRQSQARSEAMDRSWSSVEQTFNEARGLGLSKPLLDYFNAWQDVATNPEPLVYRSALIQKAGSLVSTARQMEREILGTLKTTGDQVVAAVDRSNELARGIAALNDRITQVEAGLNRETASELRDERDVLMAELGTLVEFTAYEDQNGAVTVTVGMRTLVQASSAHALSTTVNNDGTRNVILDNIDITARIEKGAIGGYLGARDDIESTALTPLRKLVASVVQEVNRLHRQGFGLNDTDPLNPPLRNFFNDLQLSTTDSSAGADITATITNPDLLTLDEYAVTIDGLGTYTVANKATGASAASGAYVSGNTIALPGMDVVITGVFAPGDSFTVSPLAAAVTNFGVAVTAPADVAASSSALEVPGNNVNALALGSATQTALANLGGSTFAQYYDETVSTVAVMARSASGSLNFDDTLLAELTARRESASGVSLDEEAANLIRYQRAFDASARLISMADELLQTVINL